jgi:hypothetical protein
VENPHAHLGLVGLEQLPAHAYRRLVAHVDGGLVVVEQHHVELAAQQQQQHSWVRVARMGMGVGVGSLASPQVPRLLASRCALGLSHARSFLFVQHG